MTATALRRVDSHLHLWDLSGGGYRWVTPDLGALHATFAPEDAAAVLQDGGMDAAVLVQADDTLADTQAMLDVASAHPWVAGVVGWVDLEHPDRAEQQLQRWQSHPVFCGVRHLVHTDPRADLLDRPGVRRSMALLAGRGLPLDVPDAWPRHLRQVRDLVAGVPGLRVVVDHLGKPPAYPAELGPWRAQLAEVAALPGTVAKVSGLQHLHRGRSWDDGAEGSVRPVWDTALELFGPDRLMYGGDWPMTEPAGGDEPARAIAERLVGELAPDERARVWAGTATEVYGLGARAAGGRPVTDL